MEQLTGNAEGQDGEDDGSSSSPHEPQSVAVSDIHAQINVVGDLHVRDRRDDAREDDGVDDLFEGVEISTEGGSKARSGETHESDGQGESRDEGEDGADHVSSLVRDEADEHAQGGL